MKTLLEVDTWLGERQVGLYNSNPMAYMSAFCNGPAIRMIMVGYYNFLTKNGDLPYIEVLGLTHKKELKKAAIEIAAGRMDTRGCVDLCKCLHVLTYQKTK
jgi:hypothetical protein